MLVGTMRKSDKLKRISLIIKKCEGTLSGKEEVDLKRLNDKINSVTPRVSSKQIKRAKDFSTKVTKIQNRINDLLKDTITTLKGGKIPIELTFRVSKASYERYVKWRNRLPKRYQKMTPTWEFRGNGISYNIYAVLGDKRFDASDYDLW